MRRVRVNYQSLIDEKHISENILHSVSLGLPNVSASLAHEGVLVIAGGGPSLARCLDNIVTLTNKGAKILALNEAGHFLTKQGIMPWGLTHVAPSPYTAKCIGTPVPDATYFLASMVPPDAFELVHGMDVRLWHTSGPGVEAALKRQNVSIVKGGQTVGLRALGLGYLLGFRNFHIFGLDSSHEDGELHAYRSVSYEEEFGGIKLFCAGREFHCTYEMAGQAQDAHGVLRGLIDKGCTVEVYGQGLLPHIWNLMKDDHPLPFLEVEGEEAEPLVLEACMF